MESPRLYEFLAAEIVSRLYDTIIAKLKARIRAGFQRRNFLENQQHAFLMNAIVVEPEDWSEFNAREVEINLDQQQKTCFRMMREHQNLRYGLWPSSADPLLGASSHGAPSSRVSPRQAHI